ncbi:MAG: biliverdin-producing heme oxygenase [Caulobacter sp.]|nr:biliverdin-producing heme oxygenase [Caulobacter sp.]
MNAHVPVLDLSRAKRLKASTRSTHEQLDSRIMAAEPFRDRERYGRFLWVQYLFHRGLAPLYANPRLVALVPDLPGRRRLDQLTRDMLDLGQPLPAVDSAPLFSDKAADLPTALGWLYVAEGSNLGAAFLFKAAAGLGLDETFGARHLAGHPDGRARHWRQFTDALDALPFDDAQEQRAIDGATAAFRRVRELVDDAFA